MTKLASFGKGIKPEEGTDFAGKEMVIQVENWF